MASTSTKSKYSVPFSRALMALGGGVIFLSIVLAVALLRPREIDRQIVGGPFRLKSQTGQIIDGGALKGAPYAIFFGFTHCPEICPTTMMDMQRLIDRLGPQAKDFKVYFVSVDPERDTPEILRSYLGAFEPYMVGLTGSPDEIAAVAKTFRVYYRKVPTSDGDYTMDHSAVVYLMGADGKFVDFVGYQEPESRALAKLRALLGIRDSEHAS